MTINELRNNVELVNEMNETWAELAHLQTKLIEYCNTCQIDMVIQISDDMISKSEYLAVVIMEVRNKFPETWERCETMLKANKEILDGLNEIKKKLA